MIDDVRWFKYKENHAPTLQKLEDGKWSDLEEVDEPVSKEYEEQIQEYLIKSYDKFVSDMKKAGYKVRYNYHGRNFYSGPAVDCEHDEIQDIVRATKVKLQQDSMGMGVVLYPYRATQ